MTVFAFGISKNSIYYNKSAINKIYIIINFIKIDYLMLTENKRYSKVPLRHVKFFGINAH